MSAVRAVLQYNADARNTPTGAIRGLSWTRRGGVRAVCGGRAFHNFFEQQSRARLCLRLLRNPFKANPSLQTVKRFIGLSSTKRQRRKIRSGHVRLEELCLLEFHC